MGPPTAIGGGLGGDLERGLGGSEGQLPPEMYTMPIEDLNLSMRVYNCLRRHGLMTVAQILDCEPAEFQSIRNFGPKLFEEMVDALRDVGAIKPPHRLTLFVFGSSCRREADGPDVWRSRLQELEWDVDE